MKLLALRREDLVQAVGAFLKMARIELAVAKAVVAWTHEAHKPQFLRYIKQTLASSILIFEAPNIQS